MATKNSQGLTPEEMGALAEKQMREHTLALATANPGQVQTGGQSGIAPTGQPVTFQAIRYNAAGKLLPPAPAPAPVVPGKTSDQIAAEKLALAGNTPTVVSGYTDSAGVYHPATVSTPSVVAPGATVPSVPVDENAIRNEVLRQQQGRIDAINGAYAQMVSGQQVINQGNEGSTRAINARSGLIGSDFGEANMSNQKAAGQKAINAINAERAVKVNEVLGYIDELATARVAAAKAEAVGQADKAKEALAKTQAEAKEYAKTLGAAGMTLDMLKEKAPDQLKSLLEGSGYDEFTLGAILNANKPKAEQIDYTFKTVGNKLIAYGYNPATGKIETMEKDLPVEEGTDLKDYSSTMTPDGTLVFTPKQIDPTKPLKDQVLVYGNEGQFAKEQAPITKTVGSGKTARLVVSLDGGVTWKDAMTGKTASVPVASGGGGGGSTGGGGGVTPSETKAMKDLQGALASTTVLGADGFMSPGDYTAFRNAWIQDGYSATAFDTKMKGYRNPNNTEYIVNKQ